MQRYAASVIEFIIALLNRHTRPSNTFIFCNKKTAPDEGDFYGYIAACSSGVTMQQSLQGLPDPQKHTSSLPQHSPNFFPEPHEHVVSNLAFCASSIIEIYDVKFIN